MVSHRFLPQSTSSTNWHELGRGRYEQFRSSVTVDVTHLSGFNPGEDEAGLASLEKIVRARR